MTPVLVREDVKTAAPVRRRRVWRSWVAAGVAVLFAAGTAMRLGGWETGPLLVPLVAFTPYFGVAALVVLGIVAALRARAAVVIMTVVCVCLAWCVLPRAFSDGQAVTGGRTLRILTANLNGGRGDAAVIVDLVRRLRVDVLSLQELTYSLRDRLTAAGLMRLLPYQVSRADFRGPEGSGVFSRYPLTERTGLFQPVGHFQPAIETALPGGSPVEIVLVHPVAPVPMTVPEWHAGVAALPPAPASGPPRILAGDFNATLDHAVLRRLLDTGYTDAAASTGQGLIPTWPHGRSLPTMVTIDHVLTDSRSAAADVRVFDVPGSDHRALFADLRVKE